MEADKNLGMSKSGEWATREKQREREREREKTDKIKRGTTESQTECSGKIDSEEQMRVRFCKMCK